MNQSSSDMIDIQIEESLVRETLMSIDSSNFKEDLLIILSFFLIIFVSSLLGIFGAPSISVFSSPKSISQSTNNEQFSTISSQITPYHRFVAFSIRMIPTKLETQNQNPKSVTNRLNFDYKIDLRRDDQEKTISRSISNFSITSTFDMTEISSEKFYTKKSQSEYLYLFFDKIDHGFKSISLQFTIHNLDRSFTDFVLRTEIGHPTHSIFQLYFRIIFSLFQLLFLIMLFLRLRLMPVKLWHLEQQLTIPLLIFIILYNNPFYFIQLVFPPSYLNDTCPLFETFNSIIRCFVNCYFEFSILVLFDSLRYKNRKTGQCFFGPKLLFLLVSSIIFIVSQLFNDQNSHDMYRQFNDAKELDHNFVLEMLQRDPLKPKLPTFSLMFSIIYLIWLFYVIFFAGLEVDVTEQYKFNMYLVIAGVSILVLIPIHILDVLQSNSLLRYSSLVFVTDFVIKNMFVFLMAYFHWPYEVLQDQQYIDSADDVSIPIDDELFVNRSDDL